MGKTAIADGLAQKIVAGDVPEILRGKRVLALDLGGMVAGAKYRGEFEERLKGALDEIQHSKDVVLFIDELHTVVGAGAAEGAIDASNMMKPLLSRGELQCIGATTLDEYREHIEKDSALERRFQPILVGEPSVEETIEILRGLRDKYEAHHKVTITDAAIVEAARLSDRYISDRFLPDKAIDLLDEASSKLRIEATMLPPDLREMELKLQELTREGAAAVQSQDYERAAQIKEQSDKIQATFVQAKNAWLADKGIADATVDADDVAEVVSKWTGIPVQRMLQEEADKLLRMEEDLHARVVGQDEAVFAVSEAVRRARAGLKDPRRPVGSFIFLGPTGVGKTELARALAEFLFDDENAMVRLDMSEYMEKFNTSRLVGSPPGYVGFDEGGQLTEAVRRRPYSVVLFDEIEKAHPDVFNMLLQILDDGRLTDGKGRVVDFKNTVVIMTSNVGSETIAKQPLGFTAQMGSAEGADLEQRLLEELRKAFRPEFLNRVDEIIVFKRLTEEQLEQIVDLLLGRLRGLVMGPGHDPAGHRRGQALPGRARHGRAVRRPAAASAPSSATWRTRSPASCCAAPSAPGDTIVVRRRRRRAALQQGAGGRKAETSARRRRQGMTRGRGKAFFGGLLGGLAGALLAPRLRRPGRGAAARPVHPHHAGPARRQPPLRRHACSQEAAGQKTGRPGGAAPSPGAAQPPAEEGMADVYTVEILIPTARLAFAVEDGRVQLMPEHQPPRGLPRLPGVPPAARRGRHDHVPQHGAAAGAVDDPRRPGHPPAERAGAGGAGRPRPLAGTTSTWWRSRTRTSTMPARSATWCRRRTPAAGIRRSPSTRPRPRSRTGPP